MEFPGIGIDHVEVFVSDIARAAAPADWLIRRLC